MVMEHGSSSALGFSVDIIAGDNWLLLIIQVLTFSSRKQTQERERLFLTVYMNLT